MQPIPEVEAAATRLAAVGEETLDLVSGLTLVAEVARTLVPSCVGVSITVMVEGDPFTVTATSDDIRSVDATQYLDGGPCVDAATGHERVLVDDVLDEQRWQLYAAAASGLGIRSSMSLPLRAGQGEPIGALNLYANEAGAFAGKEGPLAELFGAKADELMANADLSFMTREFARELPQRLDDHEHVNQALGVLMGLHGWTKEQARERIDDAAARAGTSRISVARVVMVLGT